MMPNNNDNNKSADSASSLPRSSIESLAPFPAPSMSLVGLQERVMHYHDLAARLSTATNVRPATALAPLPRALPGQDPHLAFHNHLLAVLDQAIRIINEDNDHQQDEEEPQLTDEEEDDPMLQD